MSSMCPPAVALRSHSRDDDAIHRRCCLWTIAVVSAMPRQSFVSVRQQRRNFDDGRPSAEGHHRLVPGVSHVNKCDWLVKNMTDWRAWSRLGTANWLTATCREYDWRRRLSNSPNFVRGRQSRLQHVCSANYCLPHMCCVHRRQVKTQTYATQ